VPVFVARSWIKLGEFAVIVDRLSCALIDAVIDLHYCRLVTASVAVVGSGEDSHDLPVVLPLVTLHDELMGSGDEVQSIDVGELFCDVLPKGVSSSAGGDTPTASAHRMSGCVHE